VQRTPIDPRRGGEASPDDDTPAAPFARKQVRAGRRPSLTLPPELEGRTTIGGWTVDGLVGQGGMAWIFRAHRGGGPPVALKVLDPELLRDHGSKEHVERFFREARVATTLRHPNIVGALDQGTCDECGCHWIAFEYVDGQTVEDLLAVRGRLPDSEALAIVYGVAQALACIEQQGVVHRDIKPVNILIDERGAVRLTDLGMAKVLGDGGLTQAGAVLGTPHYIAPEQAIGDVVDIRADLYALGVTLFRLVTGQFPFEGDAFLDVVTKHVNEDLPDPRLVAPGVAARALA
jgi:eukaryotic-like serine/threonine-protein kinase